MAKPQHGGRWWRALPLTLILVHILSSDMMKVDMPQNRWMKSHRRGEWISGIAKTESGTNTGNKQTNLDLCDSERWDQPKKVEFNKNICKGQHLAPKKLTAWAQRLSWSRESSVSGQQNAVVDDGNVILGCLNSSRQNKHYAGYAL